MGAFTQLASNIKGFACKFARKCACAFVHKTQWKWWSLSLCIATAVQLNFSLQHGERINLKFFCEVPWGSRTFVVWRGRLAGIPWLGAVMFSKLCSPNQMIGAGSSSCSPFSTGGHALQTLFPKPSDGRGTSHPRSLCSFLFGVRGSKSRGRIQHLDLPQFRQI